MNKNEQYNGYFNANKLDECVSDNVFQELVGQAGATYTLGIDPSFSLLDEGDEFALVLIKNGEIPTVVHNYAVSGVPTKKHVEYIQYLVKYFNITDIYSTGAICIDGAEVTVIAWENIKKLNEYLQYLIDYKKIIFAKSLFEIGSPEFGFLVEKEGYNKIPPIQEGKPFINVISFVEQQAEWMERLKIQIKCIETKSSPDGKLTWDLPGEIKRSRNVKRLRKDSYMALLVALYKTVEIKGSEQNAKEIDLVAEQLKLINKNFEYFHEQMKNCSKLLFNAAKNIDCSFNDTFKAAEELSRQALSAEECAKRLNDALILSKIAGVDSNVSTKDLADAICRAHDSAGKAIAPFNELFGIIAAAQKETGRSGAVIGNALKTIFIRTESCPETIEFLNKIGVKTGVSWESIQDIRAKWQYFNEDTREKIIYAVAGTQSAQVARALFSV